MNIRKIKLALTVGLLNNNSGNAMQQITDLMQSFSDEVGAFLGLRQLGQSPINRDHVQQRYALQFERCTLDVDLISNPHTQTQVLGGFRLR